MNKKEVTDWLDRHKDIFFSIADAIWEHPETKFREYYAVEKYVKLFHEMKFSVEKNIAGISTAFVAEWGEGKPVIAFLGEYDALPEVSQKAGVYCKQADPAMTDGHGCGHNLLGAACAAAACGIREYLESNHCEGTVRFYGCPGEEGGRERHLWQKPVHLMMWIWHLHGIRVIIIR